MTRKRKAFNTKLLKEVVFRAGEKAEVIPYVRSTILVDSVSVLIALDKDSTAELIMMKDDAVRLGYIEEGP